MEELTKILLLLPLFLVHVPNSPKYHKVQHELYTLFSYLSRIILLLIITPVWSYYAKFIEWLLKKEREREKWTYLPIPRMKSSTHNWRIEPNSSQSLHRFISRCQIPYNNIPIFRRSEYISSILRPTEFRHWVNNGKVKQNKKKKIKRTQY